MENVVMIGLFVIVVMAALLGLAFLFTRVRRTEFRGNADGKILKTSLSLTTSLPKTGDTSKAPYESSAVVVYTKAEFMRMAGHWWDSRVPGQTAYDRFEALAQQEYK